MSADTETFSAWRHDLHHRGGSSRPASVKSDMAVGSAVTSQSWFPVFISDFKAQHQVHESEHHWKHYRHLLSGLWHSSFTSWDQMFSHPHRASVSLLHVLQLCASARACEGNKVIKTTQVEIRNTIHSLGFLHGNTTLSERETRHRSNAQRVYEWSLERFHLGFVRQSCADNV